MEIVANYEDTANVSQNYIHLNETEDSVFSNSKITFHGTGNVLFVEDGAKLMGTQITFFGNNSVIYLGKSIWNYRLAVHVYHSSVLHFGQNNSFNGLCRIILSERKHLFIGDDNMFSSEIMFRNADPHLIYDADSKSRINPSQSIFIGDHVWVGQDVRFLKGAQMGSGSVAAGFAIVTKKFPSNVIAGGNPAKVLKRNTFWTRPCVHAFTEEDTAQSLENDTDEFVYDAKQDTLSFKELDVFFDSSESPREKLRFLQEMKEKKTKNRFFIGG